MLFHTKIFWNKYIYGIKKHATNAVPVFNTDNFLFLLNINNPKKSIIISTVIQLVVAIVLRANTGNLHTTYPVTIADKTVAIAQNILPSLSVKYKYVVIITKRANIAYTSIATILNTK